MLKTSASMKGLLEILTTKEWMISPDFVHGVINVLGHNLQNHIVQGKFDKKPSYLVRLSSVKDDGTFVVTPSGYQVTKGGRIRYRGSLTEMEEPFVNVMPIDGPITRNGDGCSYGSVEIRDWCKQAADNPYCRGHIFYIDTPGGSTAAKADFQMAIDYAHSRNQRCIAYIDGMCASMGMYLASMCDEVYSMHPENDLGCIGVLCAFYTTKSGERNEYTSETYHEIYDPQSFDKNKWFRDIANNGDDKELVDHLAELGVQFRKDIKKAFPAATDEHIHGKLFLARDVLGVFCDGILSFGECIQRLFALADGTAQPVVRKAAAPAPKKQSTSKQTDMKEYKLISAACGVEALEHTDEGAHFMPEMLDSLEQTLEKGAAERADLQQQLDQAKQETENARQATADAVAQREQELNAAHESDMEGLRQENQTALENANAESEKTIADLRAENEALKAENEKAKADLAAANQAVADRDAQIQELTNAPAGEQQHSPENNGGSGAPAQAEGMPAYDPSKSPMENAKIRAEWKKNHNV